MKVMVVLNIATEADLGNGTRGTVTGLVLDDCEPAELPVHEGISMLHFPPAVVFFRPDGGTDICLNGVENGLLPIVPSKAKFTITDNDSKRKQVTHQELALTAGHAFTVWERGLPRW
ncbi:hypothetical protein GG344DRAFT_71319 [Lentinula edodes]|nr:hypothetical protein GG344DRAFT_71319 [Lentinula edodes]